MATAKKAAEEQEVSFEKPFDMPTQVAKDFISMQAELPSIPKDKRNNHFQSSYASLDAIYAKVRPIANKHGFAISGRFCDKDSNVSSIEAILVHRSGWIIGSGPLPLVVDRNNMQAVGAAVTYARRIGLGPLLGITPDEDDDGNTVAANPPKTVEPPKAPPKEVIPMTPERVRQAPSAYALAEGIKMQLNEVEEIKIGTAVRWLGVLREAEKFYVEMKNAKKPGWAEADLPQVEDALDLIRNNEFVKKVDSMDKEAAKML